MRSQILGSGFVTGENLVTNDQLARIMDTSDAWIRERSGVETRYYVEQGTSTSDLGLGAARKALADAGIAKEEVDYIVFATMTPDHYFPGCGGILQEKLGVAHVPALGFAHGRFVDEEQVRAWRHVPEMNGRAVFKLAVSRMPQAVRELCAKHHMAVGDIDLLIAHQANLRINEAVQKALGLPDERVYNNIQKYGNTTAATIPIALDECRKSGRIHEGQLVCFVGLGSGFHWGAALMRA